MNPFPDPIKNAGSIIFDQGQAWHCDGTKWIRGLPPGSNVTATGPGVFNVNVGTATNNTGGVVWNNGAAPTHTFTIVDAKDLSFEEEEPVCECGSEKVGSPSHSSWCPKKENK